MPFCFVDIGFSGYGTHLPNVLAGEYHYNSPTLCRCSSYILLSRDFLDLRAESACSKALAAFGTKALAPWPTDQIPIDAFAALAQEEVAGMDLAELELRQAVSLRKATRLCKAEFLGAVSNMRIFCRRNRVDRFTMFQDCWSTVRAPDNVSAFSLLFLRAHSSCLEARKHPKPA